MYGFLQVSCRLVIGCIIVFYLIKGVSTENITTVITGNDEDAAAILPCNVDTLTIFSRGVTWHRQTAEKMARILRMNASTGVRTYGNLKNRISVGDEGALVVIRPSINDSGSYFCEIGGLVSTRAKVVLEIKGAGKAKEPKASNSEHNGAIFIMTLDWVAPVAWLIWFTIERSGMWITWFKAMNIKEKLKDVFAFVGAILTFISLICLSQSLIIPDNGGLWIVGVVFGVIGILCLIIPLLILCVSGRLQRKPKRRSVVGDQHHGESSDAYFHNSEEENVKHEEEDNSSKPDEETKALISSEGEKALPARQEEERLMSSTEEASASDDKEGNLPENPKSLARKDKAGTFPKSTSVAIVKDTIGTLPKEKSGSSHKNKLPKKKEKTGFFLKNKLKNSKKGSLPKHYKKKATKDVDVTDNTGETLPPTELTQLNWNEIISPKPTKERRVNCILCIPDKGMFVCEDHCVYRNDNLLSGEYVKLFEDPEVNFSALTYDPKQDIVFVLARSEKDGWHVASIDPNATAGNHRVRFTLSKFPSKYNWVCFGKSGLYLAERSKGQIEVFSKTGKLELSFGLKALGKPACIAQNEKSDIFVADSKYGDIFVFKPNGKLQTSFGNTIPPDVKERLAACHTLTVSPDGRLFVATKTSNTILVFSNDFTPQATLASGSDTSGYVASIVFANDSLYVAQDDGIRVYSEKRET